MEIRWSRGWQPIEDSKHNDELKQELVREIAENPLHMLTGERVSFVGHQDGNDDYIVLINDQMFGYMHLTWKRETDPSWPYFKLLGYAVDVEQFIEQDELEFDL